MEPSVFSIASDHSFNRSKLSLLYLAARSGPSSSIQPVKIGPNAALTATVLLRVLDCGLTTGDVVEYVIRISVSIKIGCSHLTAT